MSNAPMAMKSETELAFYEAVIAGDAAGVSASLKAHPALISWQDLDMLGVPDDTALHLNTRYRARGDLEKAYAVFDILMQAGPDINARQRSGFTPLMHAAINGDVRMVTALLDAGADPLLVNDNGSNALIVTAQKGSIDCAHMLLARGIPIDVRDSAGRTALFHARYAGAAAPAMIRYLIEQGASPDVKDNAGKTPAEVAMESQYPDIAKLYGKITAEVAIGQHRDARVLRNGLPKALPVRSPLRLKHNKPAT